MVLGNKFLESMGKGKVESENKLLGLMFQGHNVVVLEYSAREFVQFYDEECNLKACDGIYRAMNPSLGLAL